MAVETDMRRTADIEKMIDETKKHFGRIDVLVNNAGQGLYGPIEETKPDDYREIYELNVLGPLIAMQKVIPLMRAQGGGAIVNVSSMVSKAYYPFLGAYASTKYALNAISLTARTELAKDNIIVSIVLPGMTKTDFGKNAIKSATSLETMSSRHRPNLPTPDSAEYIAEKILLTIENGQAEIYAHES